MDSEICLVRGRSWARGIPSARTTSKKTADSPFQSFPSVGVKLTTSARNAPAAWATAAKNWGCCAKAFARYINSIITHLAAACFEAPSGKRVGLDLHPFGLPEKYGPVPFSRVPIVQADPFCSSRTIQFAQSVARDVRPSPARGPDPGRRWPPQGREADPLGVSVSRDRRPCPHADIFRGLRARHAPSGR